MADNPDSRLAAVIGAGIVGVTTALALQREGRLVTLFDPVPPGESCSTGNAGIIAAYGVAPVQSPGIVWRVPGMLIDPSSPLALRWRYLPALAPWLIRFVLASGKRRVEDISKSLSALCAPSLADWGALLGDPDEAGLLRHGDILTLFATERDWRDAQYGLALRRRRGVRVEEIEVAEARRLEPALAPVFARAVMIRDQAWVTDPLALTQLLAARFESRGGVIIGESVTGLAPDAGGGATVRTDSGAHQAADVAVCAGAWSRKLAAAAGSRLPLDTERGYHVMLAAPGGLLGRPVSVHGGGFYMTPMAGGLRCAGTVELGGLHAPANPARADNIERQARKFLPDAGERLSDWMGFRPSMPDSLPVIGPAPGHPGIWFNFGHGHLGLTLAATSARLIADMVAGREPGVDMGAYGAGRFRAPRRA